MKKIAVLLLSVLLTALVCFPVFADMGGPEMIGYTATVKQAVDYYSWEYDEAAGKSFFKKAGTIPAGTELEISNEYTENGELYGYFFDAQALGGESGYVRLADLRKNDAAVPSQITGYKQHFAVRLRVTDPNGITVYAGPSGTYPVVGVIPAGAEFTVDTLDQDGYEIGAWMYVSHGGTTGWTHCWLYDGATCPMAELLPEGTTGTVWVVKDNAKLEDAHGNALITVPKGEKLTFDAFNRTAHRLYFHVTYQGKAGIFCVDDDGFNNVVASNKNNSPFYHAEKVKQGFVTGLYAYPDDKLPTGTVRYKKGDTIRGEYLYYAEPSEEYRGGVEWYYIEQDGRSGWIKADQSKLEENDWESNTIPYDLPDWYDPNGTATSVKITVPVPTTAASVTTTATATAAAPATTSTAAASEASAEESTAEAASFAQFERTEASTDALAVKDLPNRHPSPVGIIGVCIAAAAVFSLMAFVTLRLIRRKKETD